MIKKIATKDLLLSSFRNDQNEQSNISRSSESEVILAALGTRQRKYFHKTDLSWVHRT